ncbi:MAG: HD domain-containing protein [Candidatus Cloacimonetes bacterium]|nr:HD domain-containing protein [Candidatus Cloacimonadota bacterium]
MEKIVNALIAAIEVWDPYTASHQKRVATLALAIAREMGFSKRRLDILRIAAILHDIGKINLPSEILSKPGKLADCEFNLIKIHSEAGYEILRRIEFPSKVAKIVYQHHEKMDGSGYPQGLVNGDIILEARILNVADVVEAISSNRPYRPAIGLDEALEEIGNNSNGQYDPETVKICISLFKKKNFKFEDIKLREKERELNY